MAPNALLKLIWLASPALPVGAFSYSEGLEGAIESARVRDEAGVQAWLLDQLALSLTRCEMAVVAAAWRAWGQHADGADQAPLTDGADQAPLTDGADDAPQTLRELNDWLLQTRESAEFRQQTLQTGRSMAEWLRQRLGEHDAGWQLLATLRPAPTWPLAFALAAQRSGAPLQASLLAYGFGWAENMVQAAVKCVPLGQSAGQRVLQALSDALPAHVAWAERADAAQRQSATPMLAIVSAQHEQQYSRLFRS